MPVRGNKPVGWVAKVLIALSAGLLLIGIGVSIFAVRAQQAYPARGAASLPGQAAEGGAQTGGGPAAH